ncbi:hypothetical protein H2248_008894 [Termitomyces sp. 'cryptogamus']|nr:hypothetical protein H2248_008894 [Termitomyces sp. 'cryptogamus']
MFHPFEFVSKPLSITDALRHAERRPIFSADRLCRLAVVDLEKFGEGGLMHASHPLAGHLASWPSLPDLFSANWLEAGMSPLSTSKCTNKIRSILFGLCGRFSAQANILISEAKGSLRVRPA